MATSDLRTKIQTAEQVPPARIPFEPQLSDNAIKVLERRYLIKDPDCRVVETPAEMFMRVAENLSQAELQYGATEEQRLEMQNQFYSMMAQLDFIPNSPTMMNAGRELQQLSACFVLPVPDSIDGIFEAVKQAALIHKTGGGTGFAFSRIRPANDIVLTTRGVASGPVSFMKVFDAATETIKQGSTRRGANMGILRVDHPDILDFIRMKADMKTLTNFNISVAITEKFMEAVEKNEEYDLVNPKTQVVEGRLNAREVFNLLIRNAWKNGDPGIIFLDRINRAHTTPHVMPIESTNPCGEQPLMPNESCNLGSINLSNMLNETATRIDYEHLRAVVQKSVRFLDNVVDMNKYPVDAIREVTLGSRKIGLGVMGWADMLYKMQIPYNSDKAIQLAETVMGFIEDEGVRSSQALAEERGVFPYWKGSVYEKRGLKMRNSTVTTIAPTGTISIIAGCSGGIEPVFALVFFRNVMDNTRLPEVHNYFKQLLEREGIYSDALMEKVAERGSVQHLDEIPETVRRVFVTSHDITPEWHIRMQAAFQKYTDNAVSKTVNFPSSATPEEVERVYMLAYELGCKGVTIYRDGSRDNQVLNLGKVKESPAVAAPEAAPPVAETATPEVAVTAGNEFVRPDSMDANVKLKPRPDVVNGKTYRQQTPLGTAFVTVNSNGNDEPFEVFTNIGKAGSDTAAVAEAIGRLVSLVLRLPSQLSPTERMKEIVKQLSNIGGKHSFGYGQRAIRSLPDAVAQVLGQHIGMVEAQPGGSTSASARIGDLCPQCGNATLVYQEGCQKCYSCSHTEC
ncbi:MAG: vitamin B12-dependent ribonucleotide reductase [Acidobacteriia bacterium]|nr:vitamin B12-dependent ribonucleotide reductase [Terriglobia bacterium]